MRAYIAVVNFGSKKEKDDLCKLLGNGAYINPYDGNVAFTCEANAVGLILEKIAANPELYWIEYTINFMI